jgi:putative ABC transport system substrate-binding protein
LLTSWQRFKTARPGKRHRFHHRKANDYWRGWSCSEVAPRSNRAALLFNPATTPFANIYLNPFKAAAASLGLEAIAATVHDRAEFETVIAAQAREPNGGLIVMPDGFMNVHRAEIILLAARYGLPAVYPWRFFAEQGGLLSYGSEQGDLFRRAATYVDASSSGEKPVDLPVQAPTEYSWSSTSKPRSVVPRCRRPT